MTKQEILMELEADKKLYQEEENRLVIKCTEGLRSSLKSGYKSFICYPNTNYSNTFNKARFKEVINTLANMGFYGVMRKTANDDIYLEVYMDPPPVKKSALDGLRKAILIMRKLWE